MPIYLFCRGCKSTEKLGSKKCTSCGAAFPAQKKEFRVVVKFQKQTVTKVFESLPLAQRFETKTKNDLQEGRYFDAHIIPLTFAETFTAYIKSKKEGKIGKKQYGMFESRYRDYIEAYIGKMPMVNIKPANIKSIKSNLLVATYRGKKLSNTTINRVIDLVSSIFIYARKFYEFKGSNPCEAVDRQKKVDPIVRYLTPEQKAAFVEVLNTWPFKTVANIYRFLMLTGFRPSEVFKLKWENVDLAKAIVTLKDTKTKTVFVRIIGESAVEILKNQHTISDSELVFPSPKGGGQIDNIKHSWYTIRRLAKLPENFRIYDLRHNFGTELASNGVQQTTIAALLGHASTRTSERYVHSADPAQRAAVKLITMK